MNNEMEFKKSECNIEKDKLRGPDTPNVPNANVDGDGHCTMPAYAEAVRFDTGAPCVDGLNWPKAGNDVPISAKDGSAAPNGVRNEGLMDGSMTGEPDAAHKNIDSKGVADPSLTGKPN